MLLVGRLVYEKGFQFALEALPADHRAAAEHPVRRRRLGHPRAGAPPPGRGARADGARHLRRLDRRRRPALALPDRRRLRGSLDLRAVRAGGAGGDGVELPLHRRRHRRPARGRPPRRGRAALSRPRPRVAGGDDRAGARRRQALPPPRSPRRSSTCGRFDWGDVAERTAEVYSALTARPAPATGR